MPTGDWQIRDDRGVIDSGTEEEMVALFDAYASGRSPKPWSTTWEGDLVLVQVHARHR